ncbi:FG-GAP-like repeat-containing protein, partial [Lentzea alba]|uniref:FG-GAP-like repeat-containing protein n=1 Tax=Lentzea alba TaxID=2714351 RepID=UPI0039BF3C39
GQGWQGELAEVRAWNRTITQPESVSMADASVVSGVGEWKFNEGSGSIARDSSPYGRDVTLNLAGGASWGQGVQGGGGLALNGTNSSASTSEAVLNTDQSFSVDVWAKLNDTGAPRTVVVQRGPSGVDPFTLKYDGTQWSAEMPNASTNPTTTWRAKAEAVVNKWTHLVATYDASARTLKLTVGYKTKEDSPEPPDALKSTVTGVVGWNSTGVLSVGRSSAGEFFNGNVDELKTWQGVLAPTPLDDTQRNGASVSGDNLDEFIRVEANGDVQAFLNQNGIYPGAPQHIGSGWTPERTFFADIDGDGKSEIVAVDADGTIRAFKNVNGMNGFPFAGPTTIGTATSGEAIRTKFADVDGDGRADRISVDADGRVRAYRNLFGMNERGQSTAFSTTPVILTVTAHTPDRVLFADVDGDGRADRISVDADGRVRAYRNLFGMNERGQSTAFSTTPVILTVTAHTPDRVLFADVDGDRKAEFITVNQDQTVSGYLNLSGLGYGSYDTSIEIGVGFTPERIRFADVTGDGKAEIIHIYPDGAVYSWTNKHGMTKFPYEEANQIGAGWHEPFRAHFS